MVALNYYLGHWHWETGDDTRPKWRPPTGTVGAIDLRSIPDMSLAGVHGDRPIGFFAVNGTLPNESARLGNGDLRELNATDKMRGAWLSHTGYRPNGDKLVDLLFDHLTDGSDPSGDVTTKPLMPTIQGNLELHLGRHSLVKTKPFTLDPRTTHGNRVQDLIRRDFRRTFEAVQAGKMRRDHYLRVLKALQIKHHTDDWRLFVPVDLQKEIPGPLPHETIITDDFSGDLSAWTIVDGTWTIVAGELDINGGGANFPTTIRHDTALSSDDQRAQIIYKSQDHANSFMCGVVRFAAAAETAYYGFIREANSNSVISKIIAGTSTNLQVDSNGAAPPHTDKIQANGSSLELFMDDVSVSAVTDTAITGNLQVGVAGHSVASSGSQGDDFEAADLVVPPTDGVAQLIFLTGEM